MSERLIKLEPGFYWKYKHKDHDPPWHHGYYVEQRAFYSGDSPLLKGLIFVAYRPLTEASHVYREGKCFDLMTIEEFLAEVPYCGKLVPRHRYIEDRAVIKELNSLYEKLYGHFPSY